MSFADKYINQHSPVRIDLPYGFDPDLAIVIPCYRESMVFEILELLIDCDKPCNTLVVIVVNYSQRVKEKDKRFHQYLYSIATGWAKRNSRPDLFFSVVFAPDLRRKHAGAGLARKIGMDAAIDVFNRTGKQNGIIASLDADTYIQPNYLTTIYNHFRKYPDTNAITMDFTHRFDEVEGEHQKAIYEYELYLRYMVLSMRYCGFPDAFHTIGSCFSVRALTYVKQGGMNRKHAGEDFYFLHKIFPLGRCYDLFDTTVHPSPRFSTRVPFGTGPSIRKIVDEGKDYMVYCFEAFEVLKFFYENIARFICDDLPDGIPEPLKIFFQNSGFQLKLDDSRKNSKEALGFKKRLLRHFDAFQIVKYLNYTHDIGLFRKKPVNGQVKCLMDAYGIRYKQENNLNEILRNYEKTNCRRPV